MKPNTVTPIVHNGQKFMPYPIRKPRDGAKLKLLTVSNEIKIGVQMQKDNTRAFVIDEDQSVLFPQEVQGWWYLESKPTVAHVNAFSETK